MPYYMHAHLDPQAGPGLAVVTELTNIGNAAQAADYAAHIGDGLEQGQSLLLADGSAGYIVVPADAVLFVHVTDSPEPIERGL